MQGPHLDEKRARGPQKGVKSALIPHTTVVLTIAKGIIDENAGRINTSGGPHAARRLRV